MEPEWVAKLREWADENRVDTTDTELGSQWVSLCRHVKEQRDDAVAGLSRHWIKTLNVKDGDLLVFRSPRPEDMKRSAGLLIRELRSAGKRVAAVLLRPEDDLEKISVKTLQALFGNPVLD